MRMIPKLLLVFSLAGLITACPTQPAAVGKLEVKITGLPSGATPNVTVTGPNAFKQVISSPGSTSNVITDLPVGSYKVAAANVTVNSTSYEPTVTGSPATVTADTPSSVSVVYGALRTITGRLVLSNGQPFTASSFGGPVLSVKLLGSTVDIPIDANGGFVVNNVPSTYSLVILGTSQSFRSAIVYQGLTRSNPTLTILGASSVPVQSTFATVEGKFTGGLGFSATSKATTEFRVSVPKAVSSGSSNRGSVDPTTGNYTAFINWAGGNPIAATMHALQYSTNDTNGKITAFGGYAQKTINVVPSQGTPIKQDITLAPVNSGTVNGSINWPSGITAPQYSASTTLFLSGLNTEEIFAFSPFGSQPIGAAPDGYDQLVPVITGAKLIQGVGITEKPTSGALLPPKESAVWKTVTPGVPTNIVVPAPIALTAPESAANGVTEKTKFTWSAFSGGVHLLTFFSGMSGVQTTILVVTAASSGTFPDLSASGFELQKAATYVWYVIGVAPYASMDVATDTTGLNLPNFGPSSTPTSDGSYSSSGFQPFTTAP
jgi:hypothetical protein